MTLLSQVSEIAGAAVVRDGEFETLGFLSDPQLGMLVFLESERFLQTLLRTSGIAAVITTRELAQGFEKDTALATCDSSRLAFHKIHT